MATHLFEVGGNPTFTASAAVTNGQLVEVTGPRTAGPAGADSTKWIGVASVSAAAGEQFAVLLGGVQRPTAASAIAAGDLVAPAASGQVATAATPTVGAVVGVAISTASAGATVDVLMNR